METKLAPSYLRVIARARRILDARHENALSGSPVTEHPLLYAWLQAYCKVWESELTERNRERATPRKLRRVLPGIRGHQQLTGHEDTILDVIVETDNLTTGVVLPRYDKERASDALTHALSMLRDVSEDIAHPQLSDQPTARYYSIANPTENPSSQGSSQVASFADVVASASISPDVKDVVNTALRDAVAEHVITLLDKMEGLWRITPLSTDSVDNKERTNGGDADRQVTGRLNMGNRYDNLVDGYRYGITPVSGATLAFAEAVQKHIALDLLEILHVCCGLQPIEVTLGLPLDESTMLAKYGDEASESTLWGCVSRELKWGYIDATGRVFRPAEVAIFTRQV